MGLVAAGCGDDATATPDGMTTGMMDTTSTSMPPTSTSSTTVEPTTEPLTGTTESPPPGSTTVVEVSSSSSDSSGSSDTTSSSATCVDLVLDGDLGNGVASGSNAGAGNDFHLEDCNLGLDPLPGPDYVIEWTAPHTATYSFNLADSDFDSVIGIFPPDCDAVSATECNDDCESFTSAAGYDALEGETLYIVIEGYWGTVGTFSLDIIEGVDPDCCSDDTWGYCGSTFGGWSTTTWGGGTTFGDFTTSGGWDTTGGGWTSSGGGWTTSGGDWTTTTF